MGAAGGLTVVVVAGLRGVRQEVGGCTRPPSVGVVDVSSLDGSVVHGGVLVPDILPDVVSHLVVQALKGLQVKIGGSSDRTASSAVSSDVERDDNRGMIESFRVSQSTCTLST